MSVLIALPCYGGLVSEKTCSSLFNLGKTFVRAEVPHGILTLANSSLISQGRSKIANFFMNNSDHEYLFFLDSDVGFDPNDVLKLLSYKKDIVCGAYPMKSIPLKWNYVVSMPLTQDGPLTKIDSIGMGFVMIHRRVFETMNRAYGDELKYFPEMEGSNYPPTEKEFHNSYHYFLEMKENGHYCAEDISFFRRANSLGFDVWLDNEIHLSHIGSHVFQR